MTVIVVLCSYSWH